LWAWLSAMYIRLSYFEVVSVHLNGVSCFQFILNWDVRDLRRSWFISETSKESHWCALIQVRAHLLERTVQSVDYFFVAWPGKPLRDWIVVRSEALGGNRVIPRLARKLRTVRTVRTHRSCVSIILFVVVWVTSTIIVVSNIIYVQCLVLCKRGWHTARQITRQVSLWLTRVEWQLGYIILRSNWGLLIRCNLRFFLFCWGTYIWAIRLMIWRRKIALGNYFLACWQLLFNQLRFSATGKVVSADFFEFFVLILSKIFSFNGEQITSWLKGLCESVGLYLILLLFRFYQRLKLLVCWYTGCIVWNASLHIFLADIIWVFSKDIFSGDLELFK